MELTSRRRRWLATRKLMLKRHLPPASVGSSGRRTCSAGNKAAGSVCIGLSVSNWPRQKTYRRRDSEQCDGVEVRSRFAGKAARFLRQTSQWRRISMKIGVLMVFHENSARPGPFAHEMEQLGFESFWAPEHPILPVNPKTPFPQGGPIPDIYAHMSDQFVCLGMAAANTTKLKLGTGVTLVPEHNPLVHAKQVATLDYFSGGRVLYG